MARRESRARRARRGRLSAAAGRRIVLLAALAAVAAILAVAWLGGAPVPPLGPVVPRLGPVAAREPWREPWPPASEGQGGEPAAAGAAGVRAYLVATGIFAVPAAAEAPPGFAAAAAAGAAARHPLAFTVWTDQAAFEAHAWRAVVQRGRVPVNRPPAVDFAREVAVLAWPIAGAAPEAVLKAPGLTLRGAALQHAAVELQLAAAAGGEVRPYALVTVPRAQWPVPVPPPTVPPLAVTLVRT